MPACSWIQCRTWILLEKNFNRFWLNRTLEALRRCCFGFRLLWIWLTLFITKIFDERGPLTLILPAVMVGILSLACFSHSFSLTVNYSAYMKVFIGWTHVISTLKKNQKFIRLNPKAVAWFRWFLQGWFRFWVGPGFQNSFRPLQSQFLGLTFWGCFFFVTLLKSVLRGPFHRHYSRSTQGCFRLCEEFSFWSFRSHCP